MYADFLVIGSRGRTVVVRGEVDDIDDTDNITDVIGRVRGVDDVIDELEVRGVTD
jgi:osmotically-inducible protein OsmY